jgi:cell division protein FtsI (penicillin-binding protein 3)
LSKQNEHITARIVVLTALFVLLPIGIVVQMIRVQVGSGEELRLLWREQAEDFITIPALRGDILDANGKILATSSVAYTVAVDPLVPGMTRDRLQTITNALARTAGKDADQYMRRIQEAPPGSRYIVLEKGLGVDAYEALTALNIRGIILEEQYRRRFNYGTLASHVLGYVNLNVDGMMGLEASYNNVLKGEDGSQQVRRDRTGRIKAYVGAPKKRPINGNSLVTTIDVNIQAVVEEELANGVIAAEADYGTAIVMDPLTGAIKAMANYPTYDPNSPGQTYENRRNFAISDMIEPGSTFKLVTAIAATEMGVIRDGERFYTPSDGQKLIYGQWMRDHDPLGTLTFEEVIAKSSNVAISEIAMRLKPDVFYQYVRNLGFGSATEIDLPGEEAGRLRKPYDWSKVTLPWMSVGYEVQVTPLQIATAYAAFANGGKLVRPYVVERVTNERFNDVSRHRVTVIREICEPSTLQSLLPVFEYAVGPEGTGKNASVTGMSIAGKTGTAQKFADGSYQSRYRSSFVGFYPSRNPRYVTIVVLDEPRTNIYGSEVAAPVFRNIANRLLGLDEELQHRVKADEIGRPYVAVVPKVTGLSREEATRLLAAQGLAYESDGNGDLVSRQLPEPGQPLSAGDVIKLTVVDTPRASEGSTFIMPELTGMSMRRAYFMTQELGLKADLAGYGKVAEQQPAAGSSVSKGSSVTLRGNQGSIVLAGGTQ